VNVLLVAFGKRGYGLMTHNLALSLRHHSPNVKLHLFISDELKQYVNPEHFDNIRTIEFDDFNDHRGVAPAKVKTRLYEFGRSIGLKSFLYLDVDAVCLNNIEPFLEALKGRNLATEIIGQGGKAEKINYSIWAKNADIWDFFNLDDNDTLCGIQSSWMYFEQSDVCDKLQEYLDWYMLKGIPISILQQQWGGNIPDELIYQGIIAKMGLIPTPPITDKHRILFGNKKNKTTPSDAESGYYLLSIYGDDRLTQKKWLKLYDKHLAEIDRLNFHPADMVMRDKHAALR